MKNQRRLQVKNNNNNLTGQKSGRNGIIPESFHPNSGDGITKKSPSSVPLMGYHEFMHSLGITNKKDDIMSDNSTSFGNSDMTREELDAKLAQNKAEVQAIASGMREEMAAWRETQNAKMDQISATLTAMSAKMDAKFEVIDAKMDSIDKSLNGRIDGVNTAITGINTAISGIQSGISTKLTIFGVIMAVLLAIAGWWFSSSQSTASQQPQPTVIYVQQPPAQQSK